MLRRPIWTHDQAVQDLWTRLNKYKKNACYLEYNSNVVPENEGQLPLSITIENLKSLNYSAVEPISRNIGLEEKETDIRIYHFQNESLPQRVQPATSPNVSINYIEFLKTIYFILTNFWALQGALLFNLN